MYLQLDLLFVNRDIVQHSLFIASIVIIIKKKAVEAH